MYKKILLTGASGWLGRSFLKFISELPSEYKNITHHVEDVKIKAFVLPQEKKALSERFPLVEFFAGNLMDNAHLEAFCNGESGSCLVHLAGIIHPSRFVSELFDLNVKASELLFRSAIKHDVKRLVVMSSNSPFGCNAAPGITFDENAPYNPYMSYGRSKMGLELLVNEVSTKIETCLIRSPWFYGPFQPSRQLEFFKMIQKGTVPIIGTGNNWRSMAYMDNIVQGLVLAAYTSSAAGQSYWIADERPYTFNEIVNTIEFLLSEEFGQPCTFGRIKLPSAVSEIAFQFDRLIQFCGLYNQKIHVLSEMNKNIACTIEKAIHELGYSPLVGLEEGMRRSLNEIYK